MTKVKLFSIVALLFVATQALISCEEVDDTENAIDNTELDYNLKGEGQITVTDANGKVLYNRTLSDAGYRIASSDRDVPPTLYLLAKFANDSSPYDTQNFLVNDYRISKIKFEYTFEGRKLPLGILPTNYGDVTINHFTKDKHGYYDLNNETGYFDGEVSIKSFDANRYITVVFKDCKCTVKGIDGNRFSGTIKFPLRETTFFW